MLTKSVINLRSQFKFFDHQLIGTRCFSGKVYQSGMNENFKFPQHKEFFNDTYYENEEDQ